MGTIVVGIILNLLIFSVVGFWPSFLLFRSKNRLFTAISLAPTIGFAIISILSSYLILLDRPVKMWTRSLVIFFLFLFAVLLALYIYKHYHVIKLRQIIQKDSLWLLCGFVIIAVIVILPMVLGGYKFILFRGNASDSYNYMAMARYLDREPFSWQNSTSFAEVYQKGELFYLVKQLFSSRWSTSAVLAFSSRAARIPINQFEYSYTLLFFVMAFGPTFSIAKRLNLENIQAFAISSVVCAGFWAQYVLDTRAFSEINSIPLILSLSYLVIKLTNAEANSGLGKAILLSIVSTSLTFCYVEIVPLCVLGIFLFILIMLLNKELKHSHFISFGIAFLFYILFSTPMFAQIIKFLLDQLSFASNSPYNWDQAFFPWLYSNPLIGFWGLTPFEILKNISTNQYLDLAIQGTLTLYGGILTTVTVSSIFIVIIFRRTTNMVFIVTSFVCATLIQFLFLLLKNQLWAAGKSLAYGYPFLLLLMASTLWQKEPFPLKIIPFRFLNFLVWGWILSQVVLFGARGFNALTNQEYVSYMVQNGEYRQHDFDVSSVQNSLSKIKPSNVWILVQNKTYTDYLYLVLDWNYPPKKFPINANVSNDENQLEESGEAQFVIIDNKLLENLVTPQEVIDSNSEISLIKLENSSVLLYEVTNPYGFDIYHNQKYYWLGNKSLTITIRSLKAGIVLFKAGFTPGPSLPEENDRNLEVKINGEIDAQVIKVKPGINEFYFPIKKGTSEVLLTVKNTSTRNYLPNGDPRILLLGIQDIKIKLLEGNNYDNH